MILFWVCFVFFIFFVYYVFDRTDYDLGTTFICSFAYITIIFFIVCGLIPTKVEEVKVPIQIIERPNAVHVFADRYNFAYKNFEYVKYLQTNPDSAILINYYNTYGIIVNNKLIFYK